MYALEQAMRAIRTNWIASIATITTMTLSLTILAGFSFMSLNLNQFLNQLQNELEITIYLKDGTNPNSLLNTLSEWPEITPDSLIFVSAEEGLDSMLKDFPSLQQAANLVGNPLPDRIDLSLLDPALTSVVAERLMQLPDVAEIEDGSDAVETFLAINDSLRLIGAILIVILLSSSLLAIINSIRAAIAARKDEIEVMKLVGATRRFIRSPFLIEGFLLGLLSGLVSLSLAIPGYLYSARRLSEQIRFVPLVRDNLSLSQVGLLLLALALLVGLVGSAISVSQNLQEDV